MSELYSKQKVDCAKRRRWIRMDWRDADFDSCRTPSISSARFFWMFACSFLATFLYFALFLIATSIKASQVQALGWKMSGGGTVCNFVVGEQCKLWLQFVFVYLQTDGAKISRTIIYADYSLVFAGKICKSTFQRWNKTQEVVERDIGEVGRRRIYTCYGKLPDEIKDNGVKSFISDASGVFSDLVKFA